MRLRRLSLAPYGAFANRELDFGDGAVDFHIIVGPNEAGKSTTLSAIGHLLFGFPQAPTPIGYDFRHASKDLRILGTVEDRATGRSLDVVRRRGRTKTLQSATGGPLPDDALDPFLGGVGRDVFQRMFGLNHAELRKGGDMILAGSEDGARAMLEAGSGITGLGAALAKLEAEAAAIYKVRASSPRLNVLLSEHQEQAAMAKRQAVSGPDWDALVARRTSAEGAVAEAKGRALEIAQRSAVLDRLRRTRPLLAKLIAHREARAVLGHVARFEPGDAAKLAKLREAQAAAAVALELQIPQREALAAEQVAIVVDTALLAARSNIEALGERRAVVAEAATALDRRIDDRDRAAAEIKKLLAAAGFSETSVPITAVVRRRLKSCADEVVRISSAHAGDVKRLKSLNDERGEQPPRIETISCEKRDALRQALADVDRGAEDRAEVLAGQAHTLCEKVTSQLAALRPWVGTQIDLAGASLPSAAEAGEIGQRITQLDNERADIRRRIEEAEERAADAKAILAQPWAGGEQAPTDDAVAAARRHRDDLLAVALTPDRVLENVMPLVAAVVAADNLVDRRYADSARVAQHQAATSAVRRAEDELAALGRRKIDVVAEIDKLEEGWARVCRLAGFTEVITPARMIGWLASREDTLALRAQLQNVVAEAEKLNSSMHHERAAVLGALAQCEIEGIPVDPLSALATAASHRLAALDRASEEAVAAIAAARALDRDVEAASVSVTKSAKALAEAEESFAAIMGEAGLPADTKANEIAVVLEHLATADIKEQARTDAAQRVAGIERNAREFDATVEELMNRLGRQPAGSTDVTVRSLVHDLATAMSADEKYSALERRIAELDHAIGETRRSAADASATVDLMRRHANIEPDGNLEAAVALAANAAAIDGDIVRGEDELRTASGGSSVAAVAAELDAISSDEAEAELSALTTAREELDARLIELGRELTEAASAEAKASGGSDAAEASQLAAEIAAAAASEAERYIELTSAAAVLRWAVERHRKTDQAPMLLRAGALFAQVTRGAFVALELDYDDGDKAAIIAVRSSGERVSPAGMSEGTRDQLYLALRIATIAGRTTSRPPLVCDDLLITADDDRAAAMLAVLAAASKSTQVLLFTHHRHLIDVARTELGEGAVMLHSLDRAALAA